MIIETNQEENIRVDLDRREIWQGEKRVLLTPTEGKLMRVLLENQGRVLTHRELVLSVQGYNNQQDMDRLVEAIHAEFA